ncbi:transcription factor Zn cluster Rds2 like protein [Zymoseptoria brevis]|uniref:Transcription factor Zn cluster Rds2 like protein n=1 Tax=Zymoseptoria brevis TaxID=1047168 RepID=A0A0F4GQX1_9PEZI|nr:transcription factor Zn cluster Rds2 like protein [Zymoseptoria brevis]
MASPVTAERQKPPKSPPNGHRSPKRKASEAASATTAKTGTTAPTTSTATTTSTEDAETNKKKRRKVNHACVYCRRSHMTCDLQRPCARCVKRDIGHLCHDEPRDPPRRSKSDVGGGLELAPAPATSVPAEESESNGSQVTGNGNGGAQYVQGGGDISVSILNGGGSTGGEAPRPQTAQPKFASPPAIQRPIPQGGNSTNAGGFLQNYDWNNSGVVNQFQDMHHLHPNYMFNTSEATNEYNLLNDFLSNSLIDDGGVYQNPDDAQALFDDPLLLTSSLSALTNPNISTETLTQATTLPPPAPTNLPPSTTTAPSTSAGQEISRPPSTFPIEPNARDKFYMTAADPAGLSSAEDRLHKLLRAKYDAGMLKPFNYVRGYARLSTYMSAHLTRDSALRILRQLERFRPKFREAMQSLTDMQLVLVEMWFERSLMDYDRVFASMAIPACCWRRTGEIFRGNTEMAELVRVPLGKLRDGKLAIHEIIAEESLVSYWEKFGAIAFDGTQKAILTSCSLMRRRDGGEGGEEEGEMEVLKCCFSFTIRRDSHNIPSLIVGNFLPVNPPRKTVSNAG